MRVAIFPSGRDGSKLYSILKNINDVEVKYFVDNNTSKTDEVIGDVHVPVVTPEKIKHKIENGEVDNLLVNSAWGLSHFLSDLLQQLDELNISRYYIVPSYILRKQNLDEWDFKNIFTNKTNFSQLQHLQFHVSDKCNLNCKSCQHFSNIAQEPNYPVYKKVEKDFLHLKKLFSDINRIAILGGEPLLNPELGKYCELVRKTFPYSKIDIITNGLLIRTMSSDLIRAITNNNILINISYYPVIEHRKEEIIRFLKDKGIRYVFGSKIEVFSKKMRIEPDGQPKQNFKGCRDRCCTMLRDGRLYPCYLPATVSIFNSKFGTEIKAGNSSIDIYDPKQTGKQIVERLSQPFDICKHCTQEKTFLWEQTKDAKIEDWII